VSDAARAKVLAAAEAVGYQPNALARAVFVGRSRLVAVLFSYLDNVFYADALERMCHALQERGYHALVFMVRETTQNTGRIIKEILEYQPDGLISASVELSSEICERCHSWGVPVVLFNRTQDDPRLSSVTTDNHAGASAIARHLAEIGRRRLAIIAGWEGASTNRDREAGFGEALRTLGLPLAGRAIGHFDPPRAVLAARALFAVPRAQRPDAVFVANDYMAVPVLDTLRVELGLRVPQDVAVCGFDNTAMAALPPYDLTTYEQPVARMVAGAVSMLDGMIAGTIAGPQHRVLRGRLVVRGTTARRGR
jgi:DNA-binding LacI/PurR family transcriptional regulator